MSLSFVSCAAVAAQVQEERSSHVDIRYQPDAGAQGVRVGRVVVPTDQGLAHGRPSLGGEGGRASHDAREEHLRPVIVTGIIFLVRAGVIERIGVDAAFLEVADGPAAFLGGGDATTADPARAGEPA
jgi:hypothetical protein